MPVYHSKHNNDEGLRTLCGMSLMPLKRGPRGPAGTLAEGDDIIDEALAFFRANVLFKSFEPQGGADMLLIYLTLFIHKVITECSSKASKKAAQTHLISLGTKSPAVPGDAGWPLGRLYPNAATDSERRDTAAYLKQCRQHVIERLLDRIYGEGGMPNKHWMMFAKYKFMGKVLRN